MKNTLLENSVENWLINSNELGYQSAFCQLLIADGYAIHQVRTHQGFEEGKDIIATDKNGDVHAFQLKGGDITLTEWRKSIMVQIEELIFIPVKHVSIPTGSVHTSYLITNGFFNDHVSKSIEDFNQNKWKKHPLLAWDIGILRQKFREFAKGFLPADISETAQKLLWDLYSDSGRGDVNATHLNTFFEEVIPIKQSKNKSNLRRQIGILVLYSSYISQKYRECENWVSIVKILTITSSYILLLVEKFSLEEKYWKASFDLLQNEISDSGEMLSIEIQSDSYPDKLYQDLTDGELGKFRLHSAVETVLAIKIMQFMRQESSWKDLDFLKLKEKFNHFLYPLGEGQIFSFFLCFWYVFLETSKLHFELLLQGMLLIIKSNGRLSPEDSIGIPNPYYDVEQLLKNKYLKSEEIEESFIGKSYLMGSFITLLVLHKQRTILEESWRDITYISQNKFVPKNLWQYFQWRSPEGKLVQQIPKQTEQSWKELQKDIFKPKKADLPKSIKKRFEFIPMFLLFYPQRICPEIIFLLEEKLKQLKNPQ
ncbi:hypothetical protein KAI58_00970 [Candidatus Gracilibacteria bacterium]|nr:hypothetical protein [Candidatus Gracilibacteria bacterium]